MTMRARGLEYVELQSPPDPEPIDLDELAIRASRAADNAMDVVQELLADEQRQRE
jgi:hypothetical protein